MYNISMAQTTHDEIRCCANPKAVYASAGPMFILAFAGLSGSFSGNGLSTDLSVLFSTLLMILAVWILMHPKSFISVDKTDGVFRSRIFGVRSREIPISAITRIGTRGTFLGAMTVMTITYRKPTGKEVTVRSVSKQSYDKASFHKVMDAIAELNPKLHIPTELKN
jgi:hypothetical protein